MSLTVLSAAICTLLGAENTAPPPTYSLDSGYYSVITNDRQLCPPVRDFEVTYYYYSRANTSNPKVLKINDDNLFTASGFDINLPTKIFVHGFTQMHTSIDAQGVKDAYLSTVDCNLILVDARVLFAGINYIAAAHNVVPLGEYTAKFVCWLVSKGMPLSSLELIGMSLGGQTVGIIGQSMQCGKPPKVVAYDPAGPLFTGLPIDERLDSTDGDLVIVIHSNQGFFGYPSNCGDVDFYINTNPYDQPGCHLVQYLLENSFDVVGYLFCSHNYSWRVAVYAIYHPTAFPARQCNSSAEYKEGKCDGNDLQYLGDTVTSSLVANYKVSRMHSIGEIYNYKLEIADFDMNCWRLLILL
ncbi:unnamed protein product [Brassicogethes aeneus]|uniref:Lipase domain-containing protein n=1 Tax=Brassicogethes aeneus TaxID=1431903 RepID=A0A9P0B9W1_BRAAE|nr:unnamed protein product [Brassicogethes aeneus]